MQRIQSPQTGDNAIEQEIRSKGLVAPRVTTEDIRKRIAHEFFFTADQGARHAFLEHVAGNKGGYAAHELRPELCLLTFCVLVLDNGFTVTGESACASPENFDIDIGRKIARENAVAKVWPLLGFELRTSIHQSSLKDATEKRCEG